MMCRLKYTLYIIGICFLFSFQLNATPTDSVRVSLLTCSPGSQIYALFGHTALRYEDKQKGLDVVFNYGIFDFNAPNFIWRYIKGETDYQLGVTDFLYFRDEYANRNSGVTEQELNLLPQEKTKLFSSLERNYLPENRVYRYNYFYDNCATRPRDKIEECVWGTIDYKKNNAQQSFRDIMHEFTAGHDWAEFGIDFCIGSDADKPIDYRLKMYAPSYLKDAISGATIKDKVGKVRHLVSQESEIVSPVKIEKQVAPFYSSPLFVSCILLFVIGLVTYREYKKKKILWGVDLILFLMAGVAGSIIAFLACFSVHPAVNHNYLLFVFHPIHLIYLPLFIWKAVKREKDRYLAINFVVLTLFIAFFWLLPQKFNFAVVPLALCLWIRSANYLLLKFKKEK